MDVKVSVILPTYNRLHSLPAAMNSVLSQSERDLELIVVDDASPQDVESVVRAIDDPRVRYVRRPVNGGAGAARNSGLAEARGRYIAFQDSDDLWLPGKLESQLALLEGLPETVGVVTSAKLLYGRDSDFRYGPGKVCVAPDAKGRLRVEEDQLARVLDDNRISVQSTLFRRNCYPTMKWFDERARANEDWDFAVRLVKVTKVYEDLEPVVLGFVSGDSISTNRRKQTIGVLRILKNNAAALPRYPRQHATLLRDVSRGLFKTGKPRLGTRFLIASLLTYPPSILVFGVAMLRKLPGSGTMLRKFA